MTMESQLADLHGGEVPSCLYWTVEQVADWVQELGFGQYRDCFLTNAINGRRLILMEASRLPKIGINDFQHICTISDAVAQLLGIQWPRNDRRIYQPPRETLGMYLEMKSKSGKATDELNYETFCTKFSDAKWKPQLANVCLLLPPDVDNNNNS